MAVSPAEATAEELLCGLPQRLDQTFRPWSLSSPNQPALIGDGQVWTYGELPGIVDGAAEELKKHGVRPGDRVMVVSENSLALAALVLATSAIDAWSVVVNPRLSERELDQIRDHCGARRLYYTVEISELAAAHARRHRELLDELGEELAALGVESPFFVFDRGPLLMAAHSRKTSMPKIGKITLIARQYGVNLRGPSARQALLAHPELGAHDGGQDPNGSERGQCEERAEPAERGADERQEHEGVALEEGRDRVERAPQGRLRLGRVASRRFADA